MKRSNKINLILITTLITSCNRHCIPTPYADYDWVYDEDCPCKTIVSDSTNYCRPCVPWQFHNYWYYSGNPGRIQHIQFTMKGSVTRSSRFVLRGGWGSHGFASS